MARVEALYETRSFYRNYVDISKDLSFNEWNSLPRELKSIALYLVYFNEIVLAWEKANTLDFIECEEGVEIITQYLEKNVSVIENNPARYTASYIYKVAYNCMYCICHDRKRDKDRLANEMSAIVVKDGEEFNLLDLASNKRDAYDELENDSFESEFWAVIEDSGLDTEKVMRYLLSNDASDLKKLSKSNRQYESDPLRNVSVPLDDVPKILNSLKEKLSSVPANSRLGQKMTEMLISFS